MSCRFCGAPLERTFVDLGVSPLANSYLEPEDLGRPETFYPLRVFLCERCLLVQLPEAARPEEIFTEYAYFSSVSVSWVEHARRYTETMIERFGLGEESQVVEIASNDGYLLRHFRERGVPVLGVEPARNVAEAAREDGIPTESDFFGLAKAEDLVGRGVRADLLVGNNVLAHVPDLNDFVAGLATLLAETGVVTMELPHLLRLMEENQFDTIYHEHYSYFSFTVVREVFDAHGLTLFDVDELPTHGGSLRIYGRHTHGPGPGQPPGEDPTGTEAVSARVGALLAREEEAGLLAPSTYDGFGERVRATKRGLLRFLIDARERGERVAGYGAPAKGNTLLNYCGVGTDLLDFTVDRSPHKQGRFLPGTRIPIEAPEALRREKPDYVLILPWNLKDEIVEQMADVRSWGGKLVVAIPEIEVIE